MLKTQPYTLVFASMLVWFPATIVCAGPDASNEVATHLLAARGAYRCGYRIKPQRDFTDPPYSYRENSTLRTFADCIEMCDQDKHCVAARFKPFADQGFENPVCLLSDQIGFANVPTKTANFSDVAQLLPHSCQKPVAIPTPVKCKPGLVTAPKTGCMFNITCGVELDPSASAFIAQVKSAEACAKRAFKSDQALGYTFFQGGACFVAISSEYQQIATLPRKRTETGQIIQKSCNSTRAHP